MRNSEIKIDYSKPIWFAKGWNCCVGNEEFVIVFDNGARWAVDKACANGYKGPVYSLFIFNPLTFVISNLCQCENSLCKHDDLCFNQAGKKRIAFIGEVCNDCYENYDSTARIN